MSVKFADGQCTIRVSHRHVRRTQEHYKGLGCMVVVYIHLAKGGMAFITKKIGLSVHIYTKCYMHFLYFKPKQGKHVLGFITQYPSFYGRNPSCLCYSYFLQTINM